MTRARDVLYVAGVRLLQQPPFCWYTLVRDALLPKDGSVETDEAGELKAPYRWPHPARSALEPEDAAECKAAASQDAFPAWLAERAPTPSSAPEPLRPSIGLADPDPEIARPRRARPAADGAALIRGRLVHRLLDALPRVPPELRDVAAERLLGGELGTGPELVREIRAEAEAVLAHAELHTAFAGEARAEVAIVGNVPTERGVFSVSGRIDRLIRDGAGWRLVDFKTDRSVPASAADADPDYILQLALYRKLMMDMEPGIPVAAALVYTAGPNVMPIPTEMMEQALARIGVRANAFP
jgi:ATP-dependent helicase/nuclease subunit A